MFSFLITLAVASALAQNPLPAEIAVLSEPAYPQMAKIAGISGDVELRLSIRPDGSVESAAQLNGSPILGQAAMDSARQTRFVCRGCDANVIYSITYTFEVKGTQNRCCCSSEPTVAEQKVTQSAGHVTVTAPPVCICPDACTIEAAVKASRFRSAKCLYLWKCGHHRVMVE